MKDLFIDLGDSLIVLDQSRIRAAISSRSFPREFKITSVQRDQRVDFSERSCHQWSGRRWMQRIFGITRMRLCYTRVAQLQKVGVEKAEISKRSQIKSQKVLSFARLISPLSPRVLHLNSWFLIIQVPSQRGTSHWPLIQQASKTTQTDCRVFVLYIRGAILQSKGSTKSTSHLN